MIDLINELTKEDRLILNNYIDYYGASLDKFIGLDKWLQNWNHSNQKLYKLLGNQLIYKIPISYEKTTRELEDQIRFDLFSMPFKETYHKFFKEVIIPLEKQDKMEWGVRQGFSSVTDTICFVTNEINVPIKYKKAGSRKTLQIQAKTKPMRALNKIIDYFDDYFTEQDRKDFEDFRIKHSMILNDKNIKGIMSFSIHPMDFITMSDNQANWNSCMSWTHEGCYRIGTVEMMNSNNVLCCYLEKSDSYDFTPKGKETKEGNLWNNKRWRSLLYFNKDIIMAGKSYPYANDEIDKIMIKAVKELAEKNLNWTYSFGPELYQDMKYIYSQIAMENNKNWYYTNSKKFNIIWDTNGMYNDMLNDQNTHYWCYRNKVKHKKIYSVSGKAPCLCCGEPVYSFNDDNDYDHNYNDRYLNVGSLVCEECNDNFKCDCCANILLKGDQKLITIKTSTGDTKKICLHCLNKYIKLCPCCGKPFDISHLLPVGYWEPENKPDKFDSINVFYDENLKNTSYYEPVYICEDCRIDNDLINKIFKKENVKLCWSNKNDYKLILKHSTPNSPYRYKNLQKCIIPNDELIVKFY